MDGNSNTGYQPEDFSLLYTAGATDVGDTLQIRIVESANNTARDLYLDNISLTVIPEPSTAIIFAGILVGLGFCRRRRAVAAH